jgi:DNA-binding response OmpR family regulator
MARTKILVVDNDTDTLSKIYLALKHRNYRVEVSDTTDSVPDRLQQLKPHLVILGKNEFLELRHLLKCPAIILLPQEEKGIMALDDEFRAVEKPVHVHELMQLVKELTY